MHSGPSLIFFNARHCLVSQLSLSLVGSLARFLPNGLFAFAIARIRLRTSPLGRRARAARPAKSDIHKWRPILAQSNCFACCSSLFQTPKQIRPSNHFRSALLVAPARPPQGYAALSTRHNQTNERPTDIRCGSSSTHLCLSFALPAPRQSTIRDPFLAQNWSSQWPIARPAALTHLF